MTSVGETEADELGSASLRRSAVRGVGWSALQTVASRSLSTVVFVVLARLVEPEDFGLVAIASVFVALLTVLADQGFGQALVQRPVLERTHLDTAFWLNVTIGALLALLLAGTAGAIANLFDEADLAPLLRALAMVPLISALGVVPSSLLRRDLAFASLAVRGLVGTAAGGVVGIAAAVAGAGAWALVAQLVVQT
nr:oligosaccharide flippase family protein [Acidimicrobiia bacterium]